MEKFTFTWTPRQCHCYNSMYGHEFVVFMIDYDLVAVNTETSAENKISCSAAVPYVGGDFVAFDTLSAEDIRAWILSSLSEAEQTRLKLLVSGPIDMITTKQVQG